MKPAASLARQSTRSTSRGLYIARHAGILLAACFMFCIQPLLQSCTEADSRFANIYAKLILQNIQQSPVLYTACNSMGEFCTIEYKKSKFVMTDARGKTSPMNPTYEQMQGGFSLGLSTGLIVGLPTIPELGMAQSRVVCFDLACSNCYKEFSICKKMQLKEGGKSYCPSCQRTYDLNNQGFICDGEAGRALYRYNVFIDGNNTLVVSNK